jgi:SAM-dependent methyltransferase
MTKINNKWAEGLGSIEVSDYDRHYLSGSWGYKVTSQKNLLKKNTTLFEGSGTLLDVGCGDGFWSHILSEVYTVTAEDPCLGGLMMGSANDPNKLITWVHGDSTKLTSKHDVVFARCPSFLNRERDDEFIKNLEHLLERTKSLFMFTASTRAPFDTYADNRGNYYHDPKGVEKLFSKYGKASVIYNKGGSLWATIRK